MIYNAVEIDNKGKNIKSISMSGRGVEVLGDDMSYGITAWDGVGVIDIYGERENLVYLTASMKKKGEKGIGIHSEKAPAQIVIESDTFPEEILAEGTNEPDHWTHLANREGNYKLNQYEGDGRFPDVVTGKREWPLYGKILVVALPVTVVVAAVLAKKRKNKSAQSE